jgi:type I restriction enzyme S subunit|tara:strand:+ start:648 stop:1982 length:1335 start_codon:yes stop_codon:yes gene_type:complete
METKRERYTPHDVGPSPLDWRDPYLSEVSSLITNGFVGTATPFYTDETGVPYLYGKNVRPNYLDPRGIRYVTSEFHKKQSKTALKRGDLLTVQSGHIGETAVVTEEYENSNCHALIVTRPNQESVHSEFLSYYINSEMGRARLKGLEVGSTILHINTKDLKKFRVLLPPLPEQRKIATILGTWDKAISITERLIDNSKQQKKALMQQLLTGKKRLIHSENDGFSVREGFAKAKLGELPNDWNVCLLSQFYWYQEGPGVRKHQFTTSGVKLFNGTNIQNSRINLFNTETHVSSEEAEGPYSHFLAGAGDLVIACSGISVDKFDEKIAFIKKEHLPLCMNTSTMRFKVKEDADACLTFLQYFMMSPLFKNQIRRQITGSAQLNFGPSHVGKCFIAMPSLAEQKKISALLSLADSEIDLLEQQLADLKQEKKALMQQLLTGKRRVAV